MVFDLLELTPLIYDTLAESFVDHESLFNTELQGQDIKVQPAIRHSHAQEHCFVQPAPSMTRHIVCRLH